MMSAPSTPPGIRLVRALARSTHTESYLIHLEGHGPAVLARALDEQGAKAQNTELVALERARGAGVLALIDVSYDHPYPALILAHTPGKTLHHILRTRTSWEAGEIVTLLAPLSATLARMHAAGVAHGALDEKHIIFCNGAPVIIEFGGAELFSPNSPEARLATSQNVQRDRYALQTLATKLLGTASGVRSRAAQELAQIVHTIEPENMLSVLGEGIAELATPMPIDTKPPTIQKANFLQPQEFTPNLPVKLKSPTTKLESAKTYGLLGQILARSSLDAPLETALKVLQHLREKLDALPALRRRVMVGGAAAIVGASVLLTIPPVTGGDNSVALEQKLPQREKTLPAPHTFAPPEHNSESEYSATISDDDLLAKAKTLIDTREDCFRELSLLCLEQTHQSASSAHITDRAALIALRDHHTPPPLPEPETLYLIERLGGSALIEIWPSGYSVLLMHGHEGWKIRDWIIPEPILPAPNLLDQTPTEQNPPEENVWEPKLSEDPFSSNPE